MAKKMCVICGEEGFSYYPFCKKHLDMKNNGQIIRCEKCGEWYESDKPCPKCNPAKEAPTKVEQAKDAHKITCLLCGEDSNGYHFCTNCYAKYKDKSIDVRITITNRIDAEILDKYGNRSIKCADGRYVRSLAERIIYDYFFRNKLQVIYEREIKYVDNDGKEIILHPDYYLPEHNLYIEYNGLSNKTYLRKKEYALEIYNRLGLKVEIFSGNDINTIDDRLNQLLNNY